MLAYNTYDGQCDGGKLSTQSLNDPHVYPSLSVTYCQHSLQLTYICVKCPRARWTTRQPSLQLDKPQDESPHIINTDNAIHYFAYFPLWCNNSLRMISSGLPVIVGMNASDSGTCAGRWVPFENQTASCLDDRHRPCHRTCHTHRHRLNHRAIPEL